MDNVLLSREEQALYSSYKNNIDNLLMRLANLRRQYVQSEKAILEEIGNTEQDLIKYIKALGQSKSLSPEGEWIFDTNALCFKDSREYRQEGKEKSNEQI